MRRCRRFAITVLLGLVAPAALAQTCDLKSLAMTLQEGTMPEMRGCKRAVVELALRLTQIRSDVAHGPSEVARGVVFEQDPKPGTAIKPGMLAIIRVSEGTPATSGAVDATVVGASDGAPAALDAPSTDATVHDKAPADLTAAGTAQTQPVTAQSGATGTTLSDNSPSRPDVGVSAPAGSFPGGGVTPRDRPADVPAPDIAYGGGTVIGATPAAALTPGDATNGVVNTGDATHGSTMPVNAAQGSTTPGDAIPGNTNSGNTNSGDTTSGDAIAGVVAIGASAPGNGATTATAPAAGTGVVSNGERPSPTVARGEALKISAWWWAALALAAVLLVAGVFGRMRRRRLQRLRLAWDQRVHARASLNAQGDATSIGRIALSSMPFAVAASMGFGEMTCADDIPARMQGA